MPSFFVIREGKETFLFSILCEQRDGSLRRNSIVLKSRANFFQSWNAQRSWCIPSNLDGRSFLNGDDRSLMGDFWRFLEKFKEGRKIFPTSRSCVELDTGYYLFFPNENVSPLFAFVFIDAVMSKWKPRVNARVGSTPISPPPPRQRRIRDVIKRTREPRFIARIDFAGNLNFRGLTGYDGKKREERISFSRVFWRETFPFPSVAPYSIITRIRIIIHIPSRIVDVGASLGSVMTF